MVVLKLWSLGLCLEQKNHIFTHKQDFAHHPKTLKPGFELQVATPDSLPSNANRVAIFVLLCGREGAFQAALPAGVVCNENVPDIRVCK